jgi:tetratricopeptide (TPR) repeat protein
VDEALRLAGKYFDANIGEINAHAVYADALIDAGRFDEAEKILEAALDMDKAAYKIHLLMGIMRHVQGRKEDADRHFAQVEAVADKDTYDLLKLALLKPVNPP